MSVPQSEPVGVPALEAEAQAQQENFPTSTWDRSKDTRTWVSLKSIIVKPGRARKEFAVNDLMALVQSLKAHGMLNAIVVEPVLDDEKNKDKFYLVAGERRYRAAMFALWSEVPICLRADLDPISLKEIELEENLCRSNLTQYETIEIQREIHELKTKKYGRLGRGIDPTTTDAWSLDKTAKLLGENVKTLTRNVGFAKKLNARPDIKKKVEQMPLVAAMKLFDQIVDAENVDRLHKQGLLKVNNTLVNDDCLEAIKHVKTDTVDLTLTDPPFGISSLADFGDGEGRGAGTDTNQFVSLMRTDDNMNETTVREMLGKLAPELFRVTKPGGHLYMFHSWALTNWIADTLKAAGFEVHDTALIWYKSRATSVFNGYNYQASYEPIIFAWKPPRSKRLNTAAKTLLDFKPVSVKLRSHVFEKPLELLSFLIKQSTKTGDLVFDPFAGSGSVSVAAAQTGRSSFSIEKNKDHWLRAQRRLDEVLAEVERVKSKAGEAKP
jgi:site-specific DNA-methyltransferase (adenine-specific)